MPRRRYSRYFTPTVRENINPGFSGGAPFIKETGQRSDQRPEKYEIQIRSKGYRLCWTRAARCPCKPINNQTRQPNPNCKLCHKLGFIWYGSDEPQDISQYKFTPSQTRVMRATNGYVIPGLMSSMTREQNPLDKLGHFISGTANLTVSAYNRISYFDRLINLDSVIPFSEIVEVPLDISKPLPTRYIVAGSVFLVRSVERRLRPDTDYYVKDGAIYINCGLMQPPPQTRLSVHYVCHPTWLVMTEPHTTRGTNLLATNGKPKMSKEGAFYDLPMQAMVRLEWLPFPDGGSNDPAP